MCVKARGAISGATMKTVSFLSFWLALAVPLPAAAQSAPTDPAQRFGGLWTGWSSANRSSMEAEASAAERLRRGLDAADPDRAHRAASEGRELGERVGEVVRLGDCEEGERLARAAGDFALVEAVRAHCRSLGNPPPPTP